VRRLALFPLLAVLLAGCGSTVPGGDRKVTTPTPVTVIGKLPSEGPAGDAARGKLLFMKAGCGTCHVFTPAGTTGRVGPNLDHLPAQAKVANQGTLAEFVKTSIVNPGEYIAPGYPNAMPPNYGKTLSDQQLADLVAFLVQGSTS
jgi:cytochrome c551/c552